ncbi:MAG: prolyl-tRNA synthetase associated domain-containing protein [Alphaproteobacteria bacterium]|nr:MAG: prolyl-tRNA synthetase associated domain-containing protein [Alphaproteobacteria bacterium]
MDELLQYLKDLGINQQTINHPAFFTVEEGLQWHDRIPGLHCKTLFLKDKKDKLWLVVIPFHIRADLNRLEKKIGSARLSFGKPELLESTLRVKPGSVTPFAVMHDNPPKVQVVLDQSIPKADLVCYHPMRNDYTTTIAANDLLKFLRATGHEPMIVDCAA